MELILVRHSITQGNLERRFIGRTDIPLAPEGEVLAQKARGMMPAIEALYVSPLRRCRQTAGCLWPDMEQQVVTDLQEMDFGIFEGKTHRELDGRADYQDWLDGKSSPGENPEDCGARAIAALKEIIRSASAQGQKRIGVVTHGGVMMAIMCLAGKPARANGFYEWYPDNASGWRLEVEEEPFTLTVVEDIGPWEKV